MLKDKNFLEDFDLVEQVEDKTAEVISGGQEYSNINQGLVENQGIPSSVIQINNNTNFPVYIDMDYGTRRQDYRIPAGSYALFADLFEGYSSQGIVDFDSNVC